MLETREYKVIELTVLQICKALPSRSQYLYIYVNRLRSESLMY